VGWGPGEGYNMIWQMWCVCGQGILRCKCYLLTYSMEQSPSWEANCFCS